MSNPIPLDLARLRRTCAECSLQMLCLPAGVDAEPVAYLFWPKGIGREKPSIFMADEVVHFAPIPDPSAAFRGMSWLTPITEEMTASVRPNSTEMRKP